MENVHKVHKELFSYKIEDLEINSIVISKRFAIYCEIQILCSAYCRIHLIIIPA